MSLSVQNLMSSPLGALWSVKNFNHSVGDVLAKISTQKVKEGYSTSVDKVVPGSLPIRAQVFIDGIGDITLLKTTRYVESLFRDYVEQNFTWHYLCSVDGDDELFKQVVFKKRSRTP